MHRGSGVTDSGNFASGPASLVHGACRGGLFDRLACDGEGLEAEPGAALVAALEPGEVALNPGEELE